jgi:hypothetical protein
MRVAVVVAGIVLLLFSPIVPAGRTVTLPPPLDQKGGEISYKLQAQTSIVDLAFGLSPFANPSLVQVSGTYYSIAFVGDDVLGVAASRTPFVSSPLAFQTIVLAKNSASFNSSTISYVVKNEGGANVTGCVIYVGNNGWSFGIPNLRPGQTYTGSSTGWLSSVQMHAAAVTIIVNGYLSDQAQFQTALNVQISG